MTAPLAAAFVGSDTLLLQCLDAFRERGNRVVAVATDTDKVRRYCAEHGLRCVSADGDLAARLGDDAFDHLFAITWLSLLPPEVLRLPRRSAINFHDGPLPRYAGRNAPCWALHSGETEHGVTWHEIEAKADTGGVLLQETFAIEPGDTALTLNARCFEHGLSSFVRLCERLREGTIEAVPQDLARRSWFGSTARPDGMLVLSFDRPAAAVARDVRAFDHGAYPNPIAIAKVLAPAGVLVPTGAVTVEAATATAASAPAAAGGAAQSIAVGTVLAVEVDGALRVACRDGAVRFAATRCLRGLPLDRAALHEYGVREGVVLPAVATVDRERRTGLDRIAARDERCWLMALGELPVVPVPEGQPVTARAGRLAADVVEVDVDVDGLEPQALAARVAAFLLRQAGIGRAAFGYTDGDRFASIAADTTLCVPVPPVVFDVDLDSAAVDALAAVDRELQAAARRGPLLRELVVRRPDRLRPDVELEPPLQIVCGAADVPLAAGALQFLVAPVDGVQLRLRCDRAVLSAERVAALAGRLAVFLRGVAEQPNLPLAAVPLLDADELTRVLRTWNDNAAEPPAEPCVHRQFAAAVARRPDATALVVGDQRRSYRELQQEVDRLAGWLRGRGVGVGDRVGICVQRGFGMVTAVLATLRCGAAYVPLDPVYPRERLAFMAEDAELSALVTDAVSLPSAPAVACARIDLDADADAIATAESLVDDHAGGDDLAYLIYTSGSTGRPKGVMVRHRNVANFFVGMDRVLGADRDGYQPGTWLAVTSLSFDISVLELLWTLCRGFEVVLHVAEHAAQAAPAPAPLARRAIAFSMFYFASDEGEHKEDKYRLLVEGARFADRHGFEAIWTPERHFHAFGGLYPNPAVASAAIAAMTENVQIRAGSCVATLHHPIRIAEDWALVDNLSHGRVGIAFAAGWHARDFVLKPETFAERKDVMMRTIEQVHALWRGEQLEFEGHDGTRHAIRTLPRPVQQELPTWITVAGNPETYRMAGEAGYHVLTHLLGQSLEELQQKLGIYREAWRRAGHSGEGQVTLMLHTFVGADEARVREIVREPMKGYLRSSIDLVKQAAWSFPAFKNRVDKPGEMDRLLHDGLTPADFEALLDFSFERYYRQSGLFGTPDSCVAIVDRLRAIGVDEIACLVDFGVPTAQVMESLPHLLELKRRCDVATEAAARAPEPAPAPAGTAPRTIPQLIHEHGVTHFQCTPSMAGMLLLDPDAAAALGGLAHLLVGGEALPVPLARQLRRLGPAVHDVYGPTETTVWSTTWQLDEADGDTVPIGRPLANQQVYVLDANLQPVPAGSVGELWIGGDGVTAGYFRRPELTAERFRPDPFRAHDAYGDAPRIYATGDLVRFGADGVLEYLGRQDLQVKVRGYRIELGEIEAVLGRHPGVREGVVVARPAADDGHELQLCAYYVARDPAPDPDQLRGHLRAQLPEFMVPAHCVLLPDLPRTPNLKVDRKALPAPDQVQAGAAGARPAVAAADDVEDAILAIWQQALGTDDVGVEHNFFDSGGHSILAVKVHREIVQRLGVELQVTDLFRFPTVRGLARHLKAGKAQPTAAQQAMQRARNRRRMLRRD